MTASLRHRTATALLTLLALACGLAGLVAAPLHAAPAVRVIATGLNQPKHITLAPDGSLIVSLSGDGLFTAGCEATHAKACLDESGAVDRVTTGGHVTTLAHGLDSIDFTPSGGDASGPADALLSGGRLHVLFQGASISAKTGREEYGAAGRWLGDLVSLPASGGGATGRVQASFGPFEAAHNPDHGAGTDVRYGDEVAIDTDPYAFVAYRGGYAVADAGGNDVLFVSRTGHISVLAVLPTMREIAPAKTYAPTQTHSIVAQAQAVPDSIAVGRDGALYVGELGGEPYAVGRSSVFRIVPGHRATRYATGFTSISDIAFGPRGNLYVLEIDRLGLADPALSDGGDIASGALIEVGPRGTHTTIATTGLNWSTGLAIARTGVAYISNHGTEDASAGANGGEIVSVQLP